MKTIKTDLASSIGIAIFGAIIAFLIANLLIPPIEDVSFKVINSSVDMNLTEPNPEVFNYKSLNPTVEVFVGDCTEYDAYGECIDNKGNQ